MNQSIAYPIGQYHGGTAISPNGLFVPEGALYAAIGVIALLSIRGTGLLDKIRRISAWGLRIDFWRRNQQPKTETTTPPAPHILTGQTKKRTKNSPHPDQKTLWE